MNPLDPNDPAMVVVSEYYRQRGTRPDIVALPALLEFVCWMFEQEERLTPKQS